MSKLFVLKLCDDLSKFSLILIQKDTVNYTRFNVFFDLLHIWCALPITLWHGKFEFSGITFTHIHLNTFLQSQTAQYLIGHFLTQWFLYRYPVTLATWCPSSAISWPLTSQYPYSIFPFFTAERASYIVTLFWSGTTTTHPLSDD